MKPRASRRKSFCFHWSLNQVFLLLVALCVAATVDAQEKPL